MFRRPIRRLVVLSVLAMLLTTACLDELAQIFEIEAYEDSDDESQRELGEMLQRQLDEQRAQDEVNRFLETGDRAHLEAAKSLRPHDPSVLAYDVVLAGVDGDPVAVEAAQRQLLTGVALRRERSPVFDGNPTVLEGDALYHVAQAQILMLGGSMLDNQVLPPAADAPPQSQQLYAQHCETREAIGSTEAELGYLVGYLPPAPCATG